MALPCRSLLLKCTDKTRKWAQIRSMLIEELGDSFAFVSTAQISRVFYEQLSNYFFRSTNFAPLLQMNLQAVLILVGLPPQSASTTLLRAKMEQQEYETGSAVTQALVHDALTHSESAALRHYTVLKTKATAANSFHAALELGSRSALLQQKKLTEQLPPYRSRSEVLSSLRSKMGRLPVGLQHWRLEDLEQRLQGQIWLAHCERSKAADELQSTIEDFDLSSATASVVTSCLPTASLGGGYTKPARTRIVWSSSDKRALLSSVVKYGNSWTAMASDPAVSMGLSSVLSCLPAKLLASKMKAMASSPAFKTFKASVVPIDFSKSSSLISLPLPAL